MARVRVVKNPVFDFLVEAKLRNGMQSLVGETIEIFNQEYSAKLAPPPSSRGQIPAMETTQLVTNIAGAVEQDSGSGLVGVKGFATDEPKLHDKAINIGGMAAFFLQKNSQRKGLDDAFIDHQQEIIDAFWKGADPE